MTTLNKHNNGQLPLVSILIPTYNQTKYLKVALESAINQTYENIEIIICDDSTTDDVKELVKQYVVSCNKVKYVNNGGSLGNYGIENSEKCFQLASGEYISFLYHDDEYFPTRIEKMMMHFLEDESLALITSSRIAINSDNKIIDVLQIPYNSDMKISGYEVARGILFSIYNVIGEPTTIMFKRNDIVKDGISVFKYYSSDIRCLGDISLSFKLCTKGNVLFLKETLSKFRLHQQQNSNNMDIMSWMPIDFFNLIIESYERNLFINNTNELKILLVNWRKAYSDIIERVLPNIKINNENKEVFEKFMYRVKKYNITL